MTHRKFFSKRRILAVAGSTAATLAAFTLLLWADSCTRHWALSHRSWQGEAGVSASYGVFNFRWDRRTKFLNHPTEWSATAVPLEVIPPWKDIFGYEYQPFSRSFAGVFDIRMPLGIPFVLFSAGAAWLFWRRARLFPPGHCKHCGYDLRGLTAGRCPECGAKAPIVPLTQDDSPQRPSTLWRGLARASIGLACVVCLLWGVSIGWAWYLNILYPPPPPLVKPTPTMNPSFWWSGLTPASSPADDWQYFDVFSHSRYSTTRPSNGVVEEDFEEDDSARSKDEWPVITTHHQRFMKGDTPYSSTQPVP